MSRGYCNDVDVNLESGIIKAYKKTYQAHLFQNSVPCADDIFNYIDSEQAWIKKLIYLQE
jgi:hypothetical protein